jgi:hypothetical protein
MGNKETKSDSPLGKSVAMAVDCLDRVRIGDGECERQVQDACGRRRRPGSDVPFDIDTSTIDWRRRQEREQGYSIDSVCGNMEEGSRAEGEQRRCTE